MKETTISLLALLSLFLLKVVLADELSLPFNLPINETFGLEVFQGNALVGVHSYPRCGRQGDGGKCIRTGECCSIYGWCGTTPAYCAPGNCQSQCPTPSPPPPSPSPPPLPSPPPPPPSPPPPSPPPPSPPPPSPSPPPPPLPSPPPPPPSPPPPSPPSPSPPPPSPSPPPPPPSQYPRCGSQGGGGKCIRTGECCSIYGWCGTTPAYCAPGNCQSQCPTLTSSVKNRMRGIESFYLNVVNI